MESRNTKPSPVIVFWVIWFAILNGLFILQFFVAGGIPEGKNQGEAPLALVAVAGFFALVAMSIRFLVIPRMNTYQKLLPSMIVGLALAEAVGLIGMFAIGEDFPETRLALFVVSVSAVATYALFYVSGLAERKKMH